jgi:hypothetical protein
VDKPVKAIIRHLPGNILAEDTTVALQELGYDIISVMVISRCTVGSLHAVCGVGVDTTIRTSQKNRTQRLS